MANPQGSLTSDSYVNPVYGRDEGFGWQYGHLKEPPTIYDIEYYQKILSGGFKWSDTISDPEKVKLYEVAQNMLAAYIEREWNKESSRYERMRNIGISPSAAAAAIAQTGGSQMSPIQPMSPVETTNPVSVAADVAGAAADVAAGVKGIAEASQVKRLADAQVRQTDGQLQRWCAENGFSEAQTQAFLIDNKTRDARNMADLNIKMQQFTNMQKDYDYQQKQIDLLQKDIDSYDERLQSTLDLQEAQTMREEQAGFLDKQYRLRESFWNDFRDKYRFDPSLPLDNAILTLCMNGDFQGAAQKLQEYYNFKYGEGFAVGSAGSMSSWFSRPSTPTEAAAWTANSLIQRTLAGSTPLAKILKVKDRVLTSGKELLSDIYSDISAKKEFMDSYEDAKDELEQVYNDARKEYRRASRRGTASAHQKMKMDEAKAALDAFTPESYSDELVKALSPQ